MPARLPANPSVSAFAEAWSKQVLEPAARAVAGADGKVSAAEAANITGRAADDAAAVSARAGEATVEAFVAAGREYAMEAARAVAGSDGRISAADAASLGKLSGD